MQSVLIISVILLSVYGIWFFKNLLAANRAKKIHRDYQALLDQKLIPLGFKKSQTVVGGREKIAHYQRAALAVTLSYEISYDTNRIFLTNGKTSNTLNIPLAIDNFSQTLEKWLVDNP